MDLLQKNTNMLSLKKHHKHHFALPTLDILAPHAMELSPVGAADGDELADAIVNDPASHDNRWVLEDRPETEQLEAFWSAVEADIKSDPSWADFSQD